MSDYGVRAREQVEKQLELRLKRVYTEAQKDIVGKLNAFISRYTARDKIMRSRLEQGLITEDEYRNWLNRQVFQGAQWEEKVKDITNTLASAYEDGLKETYDDELSVFATNANYQAYKLEHDIGKDFGFDLYDEDAVRNLIEKKPALLPEKIIDKRKHNHWNQGIIANSITQGIIQGESIPKIARRIANQTANHNMKASTMYARTAMTCAQNSGRMEMLRQSKDMGINVKKKWMATHDARTRDSHIHLDGQVAEVEKPFKSDFGNIDYPGDPHAHPGDVYNCRCTLVYVYPEYDDISQFDDNPDAQNMSYEDWIRTKNETATEEEPKELTLPEKVKEKMSNHQGEWTLDELIDLGKIIDDDAIEKAKELEKQYKELKDQTKEMNNKLKELNEMRKKLDGDAKKANEEETIKVLDERHKLFKEMEKINKEICGKYNDSFQSVYTSVRDIGGVDENNVETFADFKHFKNNVKDRKKATIEAMNKYPKEWLDASASHNKPLLTHWTTARAHYCDLDGEIRFDGDIRTGVHELAHRFEYCVPKLKQYEKEFYDKRTAGEKLEWLGSPYRRDEKTRKDNFISAYMGKDYGGDAYELCSMGFQELLNNNVYYFKQDKEMLQWLIGVILTI